MDVLSLELQWSSVPLRREPVRISEQELSMLSMDIGLKFSHSAPMIFPRNDKDEETWEVSKSAAKGF